MKIFKLSSLSLLALAISFLACQKELSIENGGTSLGTLKSDVTGDCLPSTVNGVFKADSLLSNSNYIEVQVDVSAIGFYQIKSDTINGYSFKGQGNFGVTGLNTVRLYPTGKPIAAGVNSFTIQYGANTCNVDITVVGVGTTIAIYTLGGAPGQCTTPQINGIYKVGTALDASNTIQVTVNVTTPGVYSFGATSTPPGLTFAAAGNFTTTGPQQVTLSAVGTPTLAGNIPVTVSNLVNTCTFTMPVIAAGGGGGTAVFTLNNAAGVCSGAVLGAGTYNTGVALTATNTVTLMATVVTAGTYTITVASVNGYTFTGSGTFTGTGPQPIVLTGTGTPAAPGANNFTATASTSSCTFSITVTGTAPPVNLDYIPETVGSNWSYKLLGGTSADTTFIKVSSNTIVKSAQTYKIFEYIDTGAPYDTAYHRKNGAVYYEYYGDVGLDNPVNKEVIVLDSSLATNATWTTNFAPNTIGGAPVTVKITALILAKGATATVSSISYSNIIKVKYTYIINFGAGDTPVGEEEIWYAKGKGNIYSKSNDVPVTQTDITEATRVQIL